MKKILILMMAATAISGCAGVMKIQLPKETVTFKTAPGIDLVKAQCLVCHSADYVSMQPPMGTAFWKAEVEKMKGKYAAPIPDDQMAALTAYLARNYGNETNAPAPVPMAAGGTDAKSLATRYGCLLCHSIDNKIVGPAYKDVAAKYKGRADAMERVSHQIKSGGGGQWGGPVSMPSFDLPDADIKTLGEWILGQ